MKSYAVRVATLLSGTLLVLGSYTLLGSFMIALWIFLLIQEWKDLK